MKTVTFLVLQTDKKLRSQIKTVLGANGYSIIVRDTLEHLTKVISDDRPDAWAFCLLVRRQPR